MDEKTWADGFDFKRPEAAPEFVVGRLGVHVARAIAFLNANANERGYVNISILKSKKGGYYCELDTWKPKGPERAGWLERLPEVEEGAGRYEYPTSDIRPDDIPW